MVPLAEFTVRVHTVVILCTVQCQKYMYTTYTELKAVTTKILSQYVMREQQTSKEKRVHDLNFKLQVYARYSAAAAKSWTTLLDRLGSLAIFMNLVDEYLFLTACCLEELMATTCCAILRTHGNMSSSE